MKIKTSFLLILKIIALTIIMFILFSTGSMLIGFQSDSSHVASNESGVSYEQSMVALKLLAVCFIDVLILTYFILRSHLVGVRLILVVSMVYYSIKTFMSQLETWYFMPNITPDMLLSLFLMTTPVALLFPPIAVFVLGKFKQNNFSQIDQDTRLVMSVKEWILKLALLSIVIYPFLYFVFGYFVAWKNPEVRAFYGGTDPENFFAHLVNVFNEHTWIYPFQVLRGLLWIGIAIVIIKSMRGRIWEMGMLVAFLFSILMNDVHLIPNPLMPPAVRLSHFIETASSNFIWGWTIVGLLLWSPKRNK